MEKRENKVLKKILLITILQFVCFSVRLPASDLGHLSNLYQKSLNSWLNNDISSKQMLLILSDLDAGISKTEVSKETHFWKSRLSFLRGQIHYEQGNKGFSIRELENCLSIAEQANGIKESSDLLSLMAEANGLLMLQKGFLYMAANYSLPLQQAQRALALNPDNSTATLFIAQFFCNAPPIAGGNLDEGIRMLKALSTRMDLSASDRFFILMSLTEVYRDNKRYHDASRACLQALSLFPGNESSKTVLSDLKKKF